MSEAGPLHVVLFEPEIPPNTGNIIRLCANAGASLHLVEPLGFELDAPKLKRAGLDYHEFAAVRVYPTLNDCLVTLQPARVWAFSTHGQRPHTEAAYRKGDVLLFGPETRGLPTSVLETIPKTQRLRIPLRAGNRSLNLSNAVAIAVYEAWRQMEFEGAG